jgi:hypothetical protein
VADCNDVSIPESSLQLQMVDGTAMTAVGVAVILWPLNSDNGGLATLGGGMLAVLIGVTMPSAIPAAVPPPRPRL